MKILAITIIVLSGATVIFSPLAIGKSRGTYTYYHFIGSLIEFLMLLPVCLHAINH